MRNRKGQVSIYMLLGLIILIGLGFVFYLRNDVSKGTEIQQVSRLPFEIGPIRNYVESCIEDVGKDGVEFIGRRGGYFILPKYLTNEYLTKTAYYFYQSRNIMPTKAKVEQELSNYVNEELFFCINNFAPFRNQGLEIESKGINISTIIDPNSVAFNVDYPLIAKKGASQIKLDSFTKSIANVRLGMIYKVSAEIINEQMKDFDSICLSCIINFAIERDLYVNLQRLDNTTILFTITDNNTKIDGFPYKFIFANKYREASCGNIPSDWPEERQQQFILDCVQSEIEKYNYSFEVESDIALKAYVGQLFTANINATGFNLTFLDNTDLFDIEQDTGIIRFIPKEEDIGEYNMLISVEDGFKNKRYSLIYLNIANETQKNS